MSASSQLTHVLVSFGLDPSCLEPAALAERDSRTVWKAGSYILKRVKHIERAKKIADVSRYLHRRGLLVPPALDPGVVVCEDGFYVLLPWLKGVRPSYSEPGILESMCATLARFHRATAGYPSSGGTLDRPEVDWEDWYRERRSKLDELCSAAITQADSFSRLLLRNAEWLKRRCAWCMAELPNSPYPAVRRQFQNDPLLAHGDYNRDNILVQDNGQLAIIDFDTIAVSLPAWDFSRLVTWVNHDLQGWSSTRLESMFSAYGDLDAAQRELVLLDQVFPHMQIDIATEYFTVPKPTHRDELKRSMKTDRRKLREFNHFDLLGEP